MNAFSQHWEVFKESLKLQRERDKTALVLQETDFLPAALEVLETPPRPFGRIVLWTLMAFIVIALVWACLGRVDVVAAAQGKVIPRGRVRVIQATDVGIVRAINVIDGQEIRAGQPLIVLDPTRTDADATQARDSMIVAEVDRARAKAMVHAAEGGAWSFTAPENMPASILSTQRELVAARIAEHRTASQALKEEQAQRRSQLAMVTAEVRKLEEQLPLAQTQLDSMQTLEKDGLVPRLRVLELQERVIGLRQDLAIRREEMIKDKAALAGIASEIAKLQSEFRAKALDALSEADANYRLRAEEVKKASDKAALTVLTSPIDGVVAQLAVHTVGAVVKPADALLLIVPKGEELIVEAMVLNKDIGFVREGQPAEVKLEAFPFTRYGVMTGEVESIGRDAVQNEELGLVFPCLVRLSQDHLSIGNRRFNLAPGLAATAEIKTDERRIIEFLLSPLSRRMQEAARER